MLEGKEFVSDFYEPVTSNVNFNLLTFGYILSLVFIHYVQAKEILKLVTQFEIKAVIMFILYLFVQQINSLVFLIKKNLIVP